MTASTSTKPLSSLTAELWDFLSLGPDLDLPQLDRVYLERSVRSAGWKATAHTQDHDAAAAIDAVNEWARYAGSQVVFQSPHRCSVQPSGMQVALKTRVVVAQVPIEVIAILDADAYAEAILGAPLAVCASCRRRFDRHDTRFDGSGESHGTGFCRGCVDRCHEAPDADHACTVCRTPMPAGEVGRDGAHA